MIKTIISLILLFTFCINLSYAMQEIPLTNIKKIYKEGSGIMIKLYNGEVMLIGSENGSIFCPKLPVFDPKKKQDLDVFFHEEYFLSTLDKHLENSLSGLFKIFDILDEITEMGFEYKTKELLPSIINRIKQTDDICKWGNIGHLYKKYNHLLKSEIKKELENELYAVASDYMNNNEAYWADGIYESLGDKQKYRDANLAQAEKKRR